MESHLGAVPAFDTTFSVQVDPAVTFGFLALQLMRTAAPVCHTTGAHLDIYSYLRTGTVVFRAGTWGLRHSVARAVETILVFIYIGMQALQEDQRF